MIEAHKNGRLKFLLILLTVCVSLTVLLAPFISDRINVAEQGSNVEARVSALEKRSSENVSRKEFEMMQKQLDRIEAKVDILMDRRWK